MHNSLIHFAHNHQLTRPFSSARESIAAALKEPEESPQGVSIGTVACSLMCTVFACIVLMDLNKMYQDLKMMKSNIESRIKRNRKVNDSYTNLKRDA